MSTEKYIYGCGAQGRVALDILREQYPETEWNFIDDDHDKHGIIINDAEVKGGIEFLLKSKDCHVHIAIGKPSLKEKVVKLCTKAGLQFINAIHPSAVIMKTSILGENVMVGAGAIVNSNVKIGNHVIVNTGAIVEHDTSVDEFVNISPAAVIGGRVNIHKYSFIGSGAIVLARCTIGENSIIGMGAVVTKNVPPNCLTYGVPAKVVKEVTDNLDWSKVL